MQKPRFNSRQFARHLLRSDDGVVAIEFGVVASLLMIMVIGATDLGLAMRHRSQMEGAVRAGLQEAMNGGTESAVQAAVSASTDLPASPAPSIVATKKCLDVDDAEVDCDSASVKSVYMEITIQQDHKWLLGFPGFSNPATLTLTNSVRIG